MKKLTVSEYGRIPKRELGSQALARLYAFDLLHERRTGSRVFDWRYESFIRTLDHVGVVQVPELLIEILPKVDLRVQSDEVSAEDLELARQNFLFMVANARNLKLKPVGTALQATAKQPVFESLVLQFASELLIELRRGANHDYVHHEANLGVLKGRIRFSDQIRLNSARLDRLFVEYDEFSIDTQLNRVLKATCEILAPRVRLGQTSQAIHEILLELADVGQIHLKAEHFDRISLDRESARFASHLSFCRLVFEGLTTTASYGEVDTLAFFCQ